MRTQRPYTNATFTRRVDHEAGRHRPPRAPSGPGICEGCGAAFIRRRWTAGGTPRTASLQAMAAPRTTLCPACRMIARGQFGGEVRITGSFVPGNAARLQRLVRNEARRAAEDNPTARLVSVERTAPDRLVVRTTTEHLAQRLGRALHKAFHGRVRYGFSHENKFAHVTWSRDL